MAGQTFGTCGYGTYSQVNIEGCPPLIRALTFLCGFPLPCVCCLPGCCMPCGFSCASADGKGANQFFNFMMFKQNVLPALPHAKLLPP